MHSEVTRSDAPSAARGQDTCSEHYPIPRLEGQVSHSVEFR